MMQEITNKEGPSKTLNLEPCPRSARTGTLNLASVPWRGAELRRFWAIARQAGVSKDGVHCIIEGQFPGKHALHDLTRVEFIRLMDTLFHGPSEAPQTIPELEENHGNIGDPQWRKIRFLRRGLKWSDLHLTNYICKQTHLSHVRFLTTDTARAVIIGLEKINETK
jgi:hypothetical protein